MVIAIANITKEISLIAFIWLIVHVLNRVVLKTKILNFKKSRD